MNWPRTRLLVIDLWHIKTKVKDLFVVDSRNTISCKSQLELLFVDHFIEKLSSFIRDQFVQTTTNCGSRFKESMNVDPCPSSAAHCPLAGEPAHVSQLYKSPSNLQSVLWRSCLFLVTSQFPWILTIPWSVYTSLSLDIEKHVRLSNITLSHIGWGVYNYNPIQW